MNFNKNVFCTTALCLITFGVNAIEVTASRGRDANITGSLQIQIEKLKIALQKTNERVEKIESCNDQSFFFSTATDTCIEGQDVEIKTGHLVIGELTRFKSGDNTIKFDTPFKEIPTVIVVPEHSYLYGPARVDRFQPISYASNITTTGFTLHNNHPISVNWIAFIGDSGSGSYVVPAPPPPPTPPSSPSRPSSSCGRDHCSDVSGDGADRK